jgi:hypothetical protein
MAEPFESTRGEPDNSGDRRRPMPWTGSPRADSIRAQRDESSTKKPQIRLPSNPIA